MPKVVHLTSVHEASDTRIVQKECATLAAAGYDVVLVAPGPQRTIPGIRHRAVPAPRNRIERFLKTIPRVYAAARQERADAYHFHDPELIIAGIALRLGGAHVFFDVHEDVPLDIRTKPWLPAFARPVLSAAASFVLRCVQGAFSAIVSATPSIARSFNHRKTVLVRNYPRIEELVSDSPGKPFSQRPLEALYLGSITALRGIEQIVTAMSDAEIPDEARLVLAGNFENELLRRRVTRLAGWNRVRDCGHVSRHMLPSLLANVRLGLVLFQPAPNHDHAMPTKFFEYMAAGLPVVASNTLLAYREILEANRCGLLVDPTDSKAIARAMAWLFAHPQEAQEMGERGRQAVFGRYEWSSEARSLVALYQEMIA